MSLNINPFGNIGGLYTSIVDLYSSNFGKNWGDWLEYKCLFAKPGKQGVVGVLQTVSDKKPVVFKMSQQIDYLAIHESVIMEGLNEIGSFCPHFCKSFGTIECKRNPLTTSKTNPFHKGADVKYQVKEDVILSEYIDTKNKFNNYIKSVSKISEEIIFSTVKQVLLATAMAQKKKRFTHYDLHSMNIMMKTCKKDVIFVYVLDEHNQIAVPTHGHYPVIIDFGFSYIENLEDGPLWATMEHTHHGFTSSQFDWVNDPKLFLVSVAEEINRYRPTKNARIFKRIVKNIFGRLDIDWECGWDEGIPEPMTEQVADVMNTNDSIIFDKYENFCLDLLQSLIILPFEKQSTAGFEKYFAALISEWVKIEDILSDHTILLYVLKGCCDSARRVRATYYQPETSQSAVTEFTANVRDRLNEVGEYCNPRDLNYEKLLCSMYLFSSCVEGVYYRESEKRLKVRANDQARLPISSVEHIYASIDTNLPTEYTYTKDSIIVVLDAVEETSSIISLNQSHVDSINKTHPICRGAELYEIYRSGR